MIGEGLFQFVLPKSTRFCRGLGLFRVAGQSQIAGLAVFLQPTSWGEPLNVQVGVYDSLGG